MAGELRTFLAIEHTIEAETHFSGSLSVPTGNVESIGDLAMPSRRYTVPAGETVTVYNWVRDGDFNLLWVRIVGSGYLRGAEISDIPTSTSDLTPAGTGERASPFELTNIIGKTWDTDQIRTELTANVAKTYTLTGYDAATGEGTPDLFESTTDVNGKIYSVILFNPDDEDDVVVLVDQHN